VRRDRLADAVGDAVDAEDAVRREPAGVQVAEDLVELGPAARGEAADVDRDAGRRPVRPAGLVAGGARAVKPSAQKTIKALISARTEVPAEKLADGTVPLDTLLPEAS
jgi:hypothetical protein